MRKLKIYIAGPYSSAPEENVLKALKVADKLLEAGYIPIVPHLTHWWHEISPKQYDTWIEIGKAQLENCDLLLRLPGESPGSDKEVAYAIKLGIPVIFCIQDGDHRENF